MPIKATPPDVRVLNIGFEAGFGLAEKAVKMETIDSHIEEPRPTLVKSEVWKRGLIMLVFIFAFGVGQSILYLTTVAQFLWLLFVKEPNKLLVEFGKSLALWLAHTARFLCCATDEKPFPWTSWPAADRS